MKPSAVRELEMIPQKKTRQRIVQRMQSLGGDPWPPGCEKLTGQERYRVRQGQYRIVYSVEDDALVAYLVKIGHRSSVYG
ncbi:MAG TPA: type II toxin-antitoxin system RelE/ParE family toxin [Candidatus Latescibacteria bacterium]|nr:type II toxin-antitoxin system RelE/ParE family toxin [Candidatus Latescibacterota bacterium]